MKKKLLVLALLGQQQLAMGTGTLPNYEYNVRCANYEPQFPNGLTSQQAPGRQDWGLECSRTDDDYQFIITRLDWSSPDGKIIPMYPVFGVPQYKTTISQSGRERIVRAGGSNPKNLSFPTSVKEDANCTKLPEDYSVVAMCRSSCYSKTVQVLTPEGFMTAENFHKNSIGEVVSISADSKIGNLTKENRKVTAKVASLVEGEHKIYVIQTETGKTVKVTGAHPLVKGDGHFIAGENIHAGDSLMNEFGEAELVTSVEEEKYFGKVYNVALDSRKGVVTDKMFVLEGLLSGDADIQNDDLAKINRALRKWINTPEKI